MGKIVKKFQFNYCKNCYFSSFTLLLAIKIKETYPIYIYIYFFFLENLSFIF